jgi:hypothetical protein
VNVSIDHSLMFANDKWMNLGDGNVTDIDPLFVDRENDDYRLLVGSPVIDAGNPQAPLDSDGTRADMGAYAFNQSQLRLELPSQIYLAGTVDAGDTLRVPITAWLADVRGVQLGVVTDLSILTPPDSSSFVNYNAFGSLAEFTGTWETNMDTVRVAFTASESVTLSGEPLCELVFIAAVDMYPGQSVPLHWLGYPETNVDETAVVTADGAIHVEEIPSEIFYGDVTGDSSISALDAAHILKYVVGTVDTVNFYAANVSDNDYVSAYDAALVLYKVVNPSYIFPALGGVLVKPAGTTSRTLAWTRDGAGWALRINDPSQLLSGRLEFSLAGDSPVRIEGSSSMVTRRDDRTLTVAFARIGDDDPVLIRLNGAEQLIAPEITAWEFNEGAILVDRIIRPAAFSLAQNAPNPFNPSTTIRFAVPQVGSVHLSIWTVNGQLVRTLVDTEISAGSHEVVWDGTDGVGRSVASGVYLYRLRSTNQIATKRLTLIR